MMTQFSTPVSPATSPSRAEALARDARYRTRASSDARRAATARRAGAPVVLNVALDIAGRDSTTTTSRARDARARDVAPGGRRAVGFRAERPIRSFFFAQRLSTLFLLDVSRRSVRDDATGGDGDRTCGTYAGCEGARRSYCARTRPVDVDVDARPNRDVDEATDATGATTDGLARARGARRRNALRGHGGN